MTAQDRRNKLTVDIEFPDGTSRERLMEVLAEALYKPDAVLSDPMLSETHHETNEHDNISFLYVSTVDNVNMRDRR